jgi:hypothetical protein
MANAFPPASGNAAVKAVINQYLGDAVASHCRQLRLDGLDDSKIVLLDAAELATERQIRAAGKRSTQMHCSFHLSQV